MKSVGSSKIGLVRKVNEDRFFMQDPLYIVTDGMGGHVGGEVASTMAIDEIVRIVEETSKSSDITEKNLAAAISNANQVINARIQQEVELKGMGTTAVVAYCDDKKVYWASVGDSRLYIISGNRITQITKDHSMVQSLVDEGKIEAEDMINHPQRNLLTKAVGVAQDLEVDCGVIKVEVGDRILLCSDGLSGYISDERILDIFIRESKEERILEDLMELVYEQGAKDNVTIIVGTIE